MGKASRNRRRIQARLRAQPWCIYCGGVNEATTVDHMPPITIFDQRRRPRGLEFSACQPCNSGCRLAVKVVGLVSRMYPDPPNDTGQQELNVSKRVVQYLEPMPPCKSAREVRGLLFVTAPGSAGDARTVCRLLSYLSQKLPDIRDAGVEMGMRVRHAKSLGAQ